MTDPPNPENSAQETDDRDLWTGDNPRIDSREVIRRIREERSPSVVPDDVQKALR